MLSLQANNLIRAQDDATAQWHGSTPSLAEEPTPASIALRLHHANFDLWHAEDRARDPRAADAAIVTEKKNIDRFNQQRNDLVQAFDQFLLDALAGEALPRADAPLHSETPGLMLDRLSILALKIFHTQEEIARTGAPAGHAERNRKRLTLLNEQRADLAGCFDALWAHVLAGERRFKLYRQLKMYNDPTLNPVLYTSNG